MRNPLKTEQFNINLPIILKRKLEEEARKRMTSQTELVKLALRKELGLT